jgi:NADPH:quinone reductase-like Zn-dependent oxidoreductase
MRALRYDAYGPLREVVRLAEVARPRPARGQVLVRVHYASINPLDWKLVEGEFRHLFKGKPPAGIGTEFSGTVEAHGSGVGQPPIDAPVVGFVDPTKRPPGAVQEFVAVDACDLLPIDVADLELACTLPVAGVAALQMCRLADVRSGQRVLVHGAAGGLGSFAVQVVRALGGRPVATGSRDSQSVLALLEPEAQVDYATQRVQSWGGPFDAVLDCTSSLGDTDVAALLPQGGRYVRSLPKFPSLLLDPLANPLRRTRRFTLKLKPNVDDLRTLLTWLRKGRVRPLVAGRYSLGNALLALELSESGRARGKLVIRVA